MTAFLSSPTFTNSTMTTGTSASSYLYFNTATSSTSTGSIYANSTALAHAFQAAQRISLGRAARIELPDGATLCVEATGSWHVDDKDAKVVYRGNHVREFNRFINASDLIEEFIGFLGQVGVRQGDVLGVPIEVLINWLILRAAEQDQVDAPPSVKVLGHRRLTSRWQARCLVCRRFIARRRVEAHLPFCSEAHMLRRAASVGLTPVTNTSHQRHNRPAKCLILVGAPGLEPGTR